MFTFGRNGETLKHVISDERGHHISGMIEMELLLKTGEPIFGVSHSARVKMEHLNIHHRRACLELFWQR